MLGEILEIQDTIGQENDLYNCIPSYKWNPSWMNENSLIYCSDHFNQMYYVIKENSSIAKEKKDDPSIKTAKNENIEIEYQIGTNSENTSDEYKVLNLKINNEDITFEGKGRIIGVIGEYLATMEISSQNSLYNIVIEDFISTESAENTISDEDMENLIYNYLTTIPETRLHLYKYKEDTKKPENTLLLNKDNWFVVDARVRPGKNTIIILKHDKIKFPTKSKFVEINPSNLEESKTLIDSVASGSSLIDLAFGYPAFGISKDGRWIAGYNVNEDDSNGGSSIKAWDLEESKVLTVCQGACFDLRLYNPSDLIVY